MQPSGFLSWWGEQDLGVETLVLTVLDTFLDGGLLLVELLTYPVVPVVIGTVPEIPVRYVRLPWAFRVIPPHQLDRALDAMELLEAML